MADIADVMDALEALALKAVYPNGTGAPSVTGQPVDVGQGWPPEAEIQSAMQRRRSIVSVYAVEGSNSVTESPFTNGYDVLAEPVHGLEIEKTADGFIVEGTPIAPEQVAVVVNGAEVYEAIATAGDTLATFCDRLLTAIQADFPAATRADGAFTIPGARSVVARLGGPVRVAERVDRERAQFRLVTWAPTPADRSAIGKAVSHAVKSETVIRLADTSQAILTYFATNLGDKWQTAGVFRRDTICNVLWDSAIETTAYEVTAPVITLTTEP